MPSLLTQRWSEQRFSNFFCHSPYQKKTSVYKPHKPFSKQSLTTESVNFSGIKVSRIASTKLSWQSRQISWSQCQHTLTDDETLLYYTSSWLSHIGCYLTLWGLRKNWPSGKYLKCFWCAWDYLLCSLIANTWENVFFKALCRWYFRPQLWHICKPLWNPPSNLILITSVVTDTCSVLYAAVLLLLSPPPSFHICTWKCGEVPE